MRTVYATVLSINSNRLVKCIKPLHRHQFLLCCSRRSVDKQLAPFKNIYRDYLRGLEVGFGDNVAPQFVMCGYMIQKANIFSRAFPAEDRKIVKYPGGHNQTVGGS